MIAVDASVVAKWYLPEANSAAAIALQEACHPLIAPDLIRLEVAASITRRVRAEKKEERLAPELAVNRCEKWFKLLDQGAISLMPEAQLLQQAITLSIEIKHTLQDCLYLAVAAAHRIPLITADEPFHNKAVSHYREIHLLSKWRAN
jgi:predicted nucleic acid-binding protein